jgi:putative PIN family toxin of toxin-antitoxin system
MIRVVLDTNVVVSALLNSQGAPGQLFLMILQEPDLELCMSADVFAEYEEVIRRPRLQRSQSEIDDTLKTIREQGFWVKPTEIVHGCEDPDDDIFLECAEAADAQYIVTGNTKHFPSSWASTRIVTPREFLDLTV